MKPNRDKVNILFPVETLSRELDFRILLACLYANEKNRILVGHYPVIDRIAGKHLQGGLYVGKNILEHGFHTVAGKRNRDEGNFSSDLRLYHRLKKNGFNVVYLHEEGAVFRGLENNWRKSLRQQMNPACLAKGDFLCVWGEFQKEFYESISTDLELSVEATGHPRLDLFKERYNRYYQEQSAEIKRAHGPFFLVNTNFAIANSTRGVKDLLFREVGCDPNNEMQRMKWISTWATTNNSISAFVKLVQRMSLEFRDRNIVIRPHPSENLDFYRDIFYQMPNVRVLRDGSVPPWLLASDALIHLGCTTGIEAFLAGKPVVEYMVVNDPDNDIFLPSEFSESISTEDGVIDKLRSICDGGAVVNGEKSVSHRAGLLLKNTDADAFENLIGVMRKAERSLGRSRSPPYSRLWVTERSRRAMVGTALFFFSLIPNRFEVPYNRAMQKYVRTKFPGFSKAEVGEKIRTASTLLEKPIKFRFVSKELITIEIR